GRLSLWLFALAYCCRCCWRAKKPRRRKRPAAPPAAARTTSISSGHLLQRSAPALNERICLVLCLELEPGLHAARAEILHELPADGLQHLIRQERVPRGVQADLSMFVQRERLGQLALHGRQHSWHSSSHLLHFF